MHLLVKKNLMDPINKCHEAAKILAEQHCIFLYFTSQISGCNRTRISESVINHFIFFKSPLLKWERSGLSLHILP